MTPLSAFELAGAAILAGAGALNVLLGLASGRNRTALLFAGYFACLTLTNLSTLSLIGWREWLSPADVRWIRSVGVSSCYLLGPLFHAYVTMLLPRARRRCTIGWWRHGLPFLAAFAIGLLNAMDAGFERHAAGAAMVAIVYHAWVVQGLPYFAVAAWQAHRVARGRSGAQAEAAVRRVKWLRVLTLVMAALWLAAGVKRLAIGAFGVESMLANTGLMALATVLLFFVTWFGLRQRMLDFADAGISGPAVARYARSALDDAGRARVAADLVRLMRERRLHADPELDLAALSRVSGWPPAYISQALNLHLDRGFFEFVADFRVEAARRRLADPAERRSILEIAMACGFGSKSTFNAAFRRSTGLTPSEFRRRRAAVHEA